MGTNSCLEVRPGTESRNIRIPHALLIFSPPFFLSCLPPLPRESYINNRYTYQCVQGENTRKKKNSILVFILVFLSFIYRFYKNYLLNRRVLDVNRLPILFLQRTTSCIDWCKKKLYDRTWKNSSDLRITKLLPSLNRNKKLHLRYFLNGE